MNAPLKVGVVGIGHLGNVHAGVYAKLAATDPALELVGVFDTDLAKTREAKKKYGCCVFNSLDEMAIGCDAVSVCTPTDNHFEVAKVFLEQGRHVLVEKPICSTMPQAQAMVRLARENHCVLQVGHVERFNPVMRYLETVLTEPRFIEVHRLSPYPGRSTDIGVVLDLMIHDFDVLLAIVRSKLVSFDAVGVPVLSKQEDIANVRLRFANGCVANVTASRISAERMRKIRVFQGDAYISLDYMRQEGQIYRLAGAGAAESSLLKKLLAGKGATIVSEFAGRKIVREPVPIEKDDALTRELRHFVGCVRERRDPLVSGEVATAALDLAMSVTERIRDGNTG